MICTMRPGSPAGRRGGFTLIELLVAIAIIGVITSFSLAALYAAQQQAREIRTRSLIRKLHREIAQRWASYETRRLPIDPTDDLDLAANDPSFATNVSRRKVGALRELMRIELPDTYSDIFSSSTAQDLIDRSIPPSPDPLVFPSIYWAYKGRIDVLAQAAGVNINDGVALRNFIQNELAQDWEGAEMLYLIVTTGQTLNTTGRAVFKESDIADTDGDGMPEFVDAWGTPIAFIRWPAGFFSDLQPGKPHPTLSDELYHDPNENPDPFDPSGVSRLVDFNTRPYSEGYRLFPLIVSAGPDGTTNLDDPYAGNMFGIHAFRPDPADSNPYTFNADGNQRGKIREFDPSDPYFVEGALDNIHNHDLSTR